MKIMMNLQRLGEVRENLQNLVSIASLIGPGGLAEAVERRLKDFIEARSQVFPRRLARGTQEITPVKDPPVVKVKTPRPSELPTAPSHSRRLMGVTSFNPDRYVPYKVLWAKVIIRAAYDFALWKDSKDLRLKKFATDAERWLFESSDLDLSFENICFAFDFPVEKIRKRTLALTKNDVKKLEFRERHGRMDFIPEPGPTTDGDDE